MPSKIVSFGYKHGVPRTEGKFVDVRKMFPDNPYKEQDLRELSGLDREVALYIENSRGFYDSYEKLATMLEETDDNRVVYLGCTGGKHRSVYLADRLARELGIPVEHRDLAVAEKV